MKSNDPYLYLELAVVAFTAASGVLHIMFNHFDRASTMFLLTIMVLLFGIRRHQVLK